MTESNFGISEFLDFDEPDDIDNKAKAVSNKPQISTLNPKNFGKNETETTRIPEILDSFVALITNTNKHAPNNQSDNRSPRSQNNYYNDKSVIQKNWMRNKSGRTNQRHKRKIWTTKKQISDKDKKILKKMSTVGLESTTTRLRDLYFTN